MVKQQRKKRNMEVSSSKNSSFESSKEDFDGCADTNTSNIIDEDHNIQSEVIDEDHSIRSDVIEEGHSIRSDVVNEDQSIRNCAIDEDHIIRRDVIAEDHSIRSDVINEDRFQSDVINENHSIRTDVIDQDHSIRNDVIDKDHSIRSDVIDEYEVVDLTGEMDYGLSEVQPKTDSQNIQREMEPVGFLHIYLEDEAKGLDKEKHTTVDDYALPKILPTDALQDIQQLRTWAKNDKRYLQIVSNLEHLYKMGFTS